MGAYFAMLVPTVTAQMESWSQGNRYPVKLSSSVISSSRVPTPQLNSRGFL